MDDELYAATTEEQDAYFDAEDQVVRWNVEAQHICTVCKLDQMLCECTPDELFSENERQAFRLEDRDGEESRH